MSDTETVEHFLNRWRKRWRGDHYTALFIELVLWPLKLIPAYLLCLLLAAVFLPLFAFAFAILSLRSELNGPLHTCVANNFFISFLATVSPRCSEMTKIDPFPLREMLFQPGVACGILVFLMVACGVRILVRGGAEMGRGDSFPAPSEKDWPRRTLPRQTNLLVGYWVARLWQFGWRVCYYPVLDMIRIVHFSYDCWGGDLAVPEGTAQVVTALLQEPQGCRWVSEDETPRILPLLVKLEQLGVLELEEPDERGGIEVRLDQEILEFFPETLRHPPMVKTQEPAV